MQQYGKYIALRREMMMGSLMPYIIIGIILSLIMYVLIAIGLWKMFEKAGEPGWKAVIPFYNFYVLFKLSWTPLWFWVSLGGSIFTFVFSILRVGAALVSVFVVFVILVFIATLLINCIAMYKVSLAYGKPPIYTIGLIFLPYVFLMLIGLGKDKYKYSSGVPDAAKKFFTLKQTKKKKRTSSTKQTKKATAKKTTKKPATTNSKKTTAKKTTKKAGTKKSSAKPVTKKSSTSKAKTPKKKSDYTNPKPKIDF